MGIPTPCLVGLTQSTVSSDSESSQSAHARRVPGIVCNFLFGELLGVTLCVAGRASGNEETQAPNRTGNLISLPSLSSSINLPSGTGAIKIKARLYVTLLLDRCGGGGGGLRKVVGGGEPQSWQIRTASFAPFFFPSSSQVSHTHSHEEPPGVTKAKTG